MGEYDLPRERERWRRMFVASILGGIYAHGLEHHTSDSGALETDVRDAADKMLQELEMYPLPEGAAFLEPDDVDDDPHHTEMPAVTALTSAREGGGA